MRMKIAENIVGYLGTIGAFGFFFLDVRAIFFKTFIRGTIFLFCVSVVATIER